MDKDIQLLPRAFTLQNQSKGYTLPELMITVAILALSVSLAVPKLRSFNLENRMVVSVNQFILSLQFTRSEAITRGQRVTLCPSNHQIACTNYREWHHGWIVFVDENGNRERDSNESILQVQYAPKGKITILSSRHRGRITYQPIGTSGGANATFTFCDERKEQHARAIILARSGRPRISRTLPNGRPLHCPSG